MVVSRECCGYSGRFGVDAMPTHAASSVLSLPGGLIDANKDRQGFLHPAVAGAANGCCAQIVEADRDADMGVGRTHAVGRIERDPAEGGHEGLRPGVAGVLVGHAVVSAKVAAHIAGRNAGAAGGGEKDMGVVLADAALER